LPIGVSPCGIVRKGGRRLAMTSHGIVFSRTRIVSTQSCSRPLWRSSITRHGTLKSWPIQLGKTGAAEMLDATLCEQAKTSQAPTRLAEASSMKGGQQKGGLMPEVGRQADHRLRADILISWRSGTIGTPDCLHIICNSGASE